MILKGIETDLGKCPNCGEYECLKRTDNSVAKIRNKKGELEIMPIIKCVKCNSYFEEGFEQDNDGEYVFGHYIEKLTKREINKYGCDNWIFTQNL